MKVTVERVGGGPVKFEDFADKHGLAMEVRERASASPAARFYASFRGVEVSEGCILIGVYGNGRTPEEAIADYAPMLCGKRIRVGYPQLPAGSEGIYITCPTEWLP